MARFRPCTRSGDRRGAALVSVTFLVMALSVLSYSALTFTSAAVREQQGVRRQLTARYIADAALAEAVFELQTGGTGNIGSAQQPRELGHSRYWVERQAMPGEMISLTATGVHDDDLTRLQLILQADRNSIWRWAAFGEESMTVSGAAFVDSYDPGLGRYADQVQLHPNGHEYARGQAAIGSNHDVLVNGDARVFGDAHSGPEGTTTVASTAVLTGATTPSTTLVAMPPIELPVLTSEGSIVVPDGMIHALPPGSHGFEDLLVGERSRLLIVGPAKLVFRDLVLGSRAQLLVDATLGPVEIYVQGDFVMGNMSFAGSLLRNPTDLAFFLMSDNIRDTEADDLDRIEFDHDAKMYASLYAPSAEIDIKTRFELYGAVVARRVVLAGDAALHFDESIETARAPGIRNFRTVSWRVLSSGLVEHSPSTP